MILTAWHTHIHTHSGIVLLPKQRHIQHSPLSTSSAHSLDWIPPCAHTHTHANRPHNHPLSHTHIPTWIPLPMKPHLSYFRGLSLCPWQTQTHTDSKWGFFCKCDFDRTVINSVWQNMVLETLYDLYELFLIWMLNVCFKRSALLYNGIQWEFINFSLFNNDCILYYL